MARYCGIPDVGAEWSYADRLADMAGDIGDELHGEPDFDDDGLPIFFEEDGIRYWMDSNGNVEKCKFQRKEIKHEDICD